MTEQNSPLTQEHVNNMVIRVRGLMTEVSSIDPRLNLVIHLYRQFQTHQTYRNFLLLARAIEDAEEKIYNSEEGIKLGNHEDDPHEDDLHEDNMQVDSDEDASDP